MPVPKQAQRARTRYACFDHASPDDGQAYGYAAAFGAGPSCEHEAVAQLVDVHRNAISYLNRDGLVAEDELFCAQQNAQTVRNAEEYYRHMFGDRVTSWNLRDRHMAQTLDALLAHLDRHPGAREGRPARIVVWAHNSHVGDARATEVGADGQLTLGQLVRQHYGAQCRLIGFSTYQGTVTAASEWGGDAFLKTVRPALPGSGDVAMDEIDLRQRGIVHDQTQAMRLARQIVSPDRDAFSDQALDRPRANAAERARHQEFFSHVSPR